ncbi:IS66 family element, transposase [Lachnoanaerobaculum saburreum F0468]|uniref:IS66 family element, transposase n=1 Tax=Lachnoanaerobaculum saburreum F0468 TaxID=1095750 RepID=I0RAW1_9FIRM|nr:transposase [Lachnoanaerobaculum saburreum]EIC96819.1 IS66 family element, transposase [Lachnoanaerobaculum saburreum F0468]
MKIPFEYVGALQQENKILKKEVADFKSGERFKQIKREHQKLIDEYRRQIKQLNLVIEGLRKDVKNAWKWCEEAYEDALKELHASMKEMKHALKEKEKKWLLSEREREQALSKITDLCRENSELKTQLDDEKGRNKKLLAQLNRDYENSSIPSSQSRNRSKIPNNRECTGRKPGAQPGHVHHGRKKQMPTQVVCLPAPKEVAKDPGFKKTNKTIIKQLISVELIMNVTEYQADVYYNSTTGERIHASFPSGVVDDVNYDGSIKALLFLLNTDCAVSIDKSRRFLSDLTGGKLKISKGMINKLCREFSSKTQAEQKKIFADLLSSPVMNTDCTNARVNGESAYVYVCATPDEQNVLYFAREKKGHEGVKGTVTEDFQGILVHDHEITFYKYGNAHQECLAHVQRYLKDSMENEPSLTWHRKMRELIREMVHYRNEHADDAHLDPKIVSNFEGKYQEILEKAGEEYIFHEPSPYYRDGYNLYRRMQEYKTQHLLFLHDMRVPTTNNTAERCLRDYKRKQTFAMTFRSFESIEELCQSKGVLLGVRKNNPNLYTVVKEIFNR